MIVLLFIILPIALSLCWFLPCVRAQGKARVLRKRDYLRIALLYGLLITCILIIITELIWDAILGTPGEEDLLRNILFSFFRAALLEEAWKFFGFWLAQRKLKLQRKIDFMLTAGTIGMVYNIVEKASQLSALGAFVGSLIPLHILWQLRQGGYFYEYRTAKAAGDRKRAGRELFMTLAVPFLLHGIWDSLLDVAVYCLMLEDAFFWQAAGGILFISLVFGALVYGIRTVRYVRRVAREEEGKEAL